MSKKWVSEWSVVIRYNTNWAICQHDFRLTRMESFYLGSNRAEKEAREFCTTFQPFVEVLYCGLTADIPEDLRQAVIMEHRC